MKTLALFLSCLLFTLTANPLLISAQDPVLDTDGNPVRPGVDYYAVPPAGESTGGGGLGLEGQRNRPPCPLDVVQVQNETSNGLPLTFSPVSPDDQVVRLGIDQNIAFSNAASTCVPANFWMLEFNDALSQYFVSTGGVKGNPGRETLSNWFGIQRYEDAYMFYFCPSVCDICRPVCGNIGVNVGGGRRRLGLRNQPLKVTFKKA